MRRRSKWMIAVGVAVAAVGVFFFLQGPSEPSYRGRGLSAWMTDLSNGDYQQQQRAREAIKALGPAAVPYLTNSLAQRQSPALRIARNGLIPKRIINMTRRIVRWESPMTESRTAARALWMLGPSAKSAIPELLAALHDPDVNLAQSAAQALGEIGAEALPPLRERLKVATQPEISYVLLAFATMRTNAAAVAPDIVQLMKGDSASLADHASVVLSTLGPAAAEPLFTCFESTNTKVQIRALNALRNLSGQIPNLGATPIDATTVSLDAPSHGTNLSLQPVLYLTRSTNAEVRLSAYQCFWSFYPPAETSGPIWSHALEDGDPRVRDFAVYGLTMFPSTVRRYNAELAEIAKGQSAPAQVASNALTTFHAWPKEK